MSEMCGPLRVMYLGCEGVASGSAATVAGVVTVAVAVVVVVAWVAMVAMVQTPEADMRGCR